METTPKAPRRPGFGRGTYIVSRDLQLGVLAYSLCLAGGVTALNALLQTPLSGPHKAIAMGISLVIFTALGIFGLRLTNRIAGPIYRLTRHMQDVIAGKEVRELTLRKGDYFTELVATYNEMLRLRGEGAAKAREPAGEA